MGKTVLLLLAAVVASGTILSLGQAEIATGTNESHRFNAAEVFAREMSDAGTNAVLTSVMADGAFDPTMPMALCDSSTFGGGTYQLLGYQTRKNNQEAEFIVRGNFPYRMDSTGAPQNTSVTLRSLYRWRPSIWPGPFPIGASLVTMDMNGGSITGDVLHNGTYHSFPAYFGNDRYTRYGGAK